MPLAEGFSGLVSLRPTQPHLSAFRAQQVKTSRVNLRAGFHAPRMMSDLGGVRQRIEQAITSTVAGADAADVEEMLAILTASTRSYERKLAKTGGQVNVDDYISQLGARYVADEGLMDAGTWAQVAQKVAQSGDGAAQSPLSAIRMVDENIKAGIASLSISGDDKEEVMAIVTTTCRSMARKYKLQEGGGGDVAGEVEALLYARLVSEEQLLSVQDWSAITGGGVTGGNQAAPAATSPPPAMRTGAAPAPRRQVVPEILEELVKLFPTKSTRELTMAAAAAAGPGLEDAVFQVLSLEGPGGSDVGDIDGDVDSALSSIQQGYDPLAAAAPYPGAAKRAPDAVVAGEQQRLVTQFVTTGACGFGHCFDIKTGDKPVTVTNLFSASSPGLNWGQGMAVRMKIYTTKQQRRSRGVELDPTAWRLVGQSDTVTLPMVSWADGDQAQYGELPMNEPVTIPANSVQGFLVHSSDLYGLVQSVGVGGGGEMDVWGEGGEEEGQLPFKAGDLISEDGNIKLLAGLAIGHNCFQDLEGLVMPTAGGFVGCVDYIVEN